MIHGIRIQKMGGIVGIHADDHLRVILPCFLPEGRARIPAFLAAHLFEQAEKIADEQSITTNYNNGATIANKASIFGFRTASAGNVPHKTSNGTIEWKPVNTALLVEGASGSTVTSATCTNKLSFVSASDSNVKFTVTDEGNGNVTVTVGVYWK